MYMEGRHYWFAGTVQQASSYSLGAEDRRTFVSIGECVDEDAAPAEKPMRASCDVQRRLLFVA